MALTYRYVTDAGAGAADGTSIANAMSYATFTDYMVTGGSFTAAPGDVFRAIGAITGRTTTTDTWVNGGNATSPVVVEGWTSGGTTAYAGRTNGNGSLITTDFPSITYTTGRLNISGSFILIRYLDIDSANNGSSVTTVSDSVVDGCSITNSSTGASAVGVTMGTSRSLLINSDITMSGASGGTSGVVASSASRVLFNRITVTSTIPAVQSTAANTSFLVVGNTIYGSGGVGIYLGATSGNLLSINNTIYGCSGDGIGIITGTTGLNAVIGNMITDNGGYGVDFNSASVAGFVGYNRTRDNTSGAYNSATDWVAATSIGDVTTDTGGASTDYVNAGALDFNLIAASPATSAGLPQYASIGALQRSQTGGGSAVQTSYAFA